MLFNKMCYTIDVNDSKVDNVAEKYKTMTKDENSRNRYDAETKLHLYQRFKNMTNEELQKQYDHLKGLKYIHGDREVHLMYDIIDDICQEKKFKIVKKS